MNKNITVQFVAEANIGSLIIQWMTRCDYSHVDIVMPDGSLLGSRFSLFPSDNGVKIRPPNYMNFSRVKRVEFPINEDVVIEAAKKYIGCKYSWKSDAAFLNSEIDKYISNNAFNCSSFVGRVFSDCGLNLYKTEGYNITPRDILIHPEAIIK